MVNSVEKLDLWTNDESVLGLWVELTNLLPEEVLHEGFLWLGKVKLVLDFLEGKGSVLNVLSGNLSSTSVQFLSGLGLGTGVDSKDLSELGGLEVLGILVGQVDLSDLVVSLVLLVSNFSSNDCILIGVWKINLEQHETGNSGVELLHLLGELFFHGLTDGGSVTPVAWSIVIRGSLKDSVSGNSSKDFLVVILALEVELWKLFLDQLVLESETNLEIKTLLGSGAQSAVLGVGVL